MAEVAAGRWKTGVVDDQSDTPTISKGAEVDIEASLTGGDPRTLRNAELVVDAVLRSPAKVGELFDCVFSDDEVVRMRASDALEKVCKQQPELLGRHVERVLVDMAGVPQPSVQWHLAQILGEVALDPDQQAGAVRLLYDNLARFDDWIVINLTLATLADFARRDPSLRPDFVGILRRYQDSAYKSVAARVRKLLTEFAPESG